jgi:uncharacterized repeat protein (TIGR03837 family)
MRFSSIDIFCRVVDNFGDAGVVYRFANECKRARPHCRVRVFIDDVTTLHCMVPGIDPSKTAQELDSVAYYSWNAMTEGLVGEGTAEVLVEAFACYLPEPVLEAACRRPTVIINLEHLSAEPWVEGYHLKESLTGREMLKKYFYMPGFTKETGGVIIGATGNPPSDAGDRERNAFFGELLGSRGVSAGDVRGALFGTVFTYLRGFDTLLTDLRATGGDIVVLVLGEKSAEGMASALTRSATTRIGSSAYATGAVRVIIMPFLPQQQYDRLLGMADFNFVRGEDSLVRAVLSAKPFVWNAYVQENAYQRIKVKAFLDVFRGYFDDEDAYAHYRELLMRFNDADEEGTRQTTGERYVRFFEDLNKIGRATKKMSYFIRENCNLVKKFMEFLDRMEWQV